MTDHGTRHELTPVLTGRVTAYPPALSAEGLLDQLPRHHELVPGHSLGAPALVPAVEEPAPARAVHSEPAWRLSGSVGGLGPAFFTLFKRSPDLPTSFSRPQSGTEGSRRLSVEGQALDARDGNTALALSAHRLVDHTAEKAVVPSPVRCRRAGAGGLMRRGFEVAPCPTHRTRSSGTDSIHRDRFDAFVASPSGWL